MKNESTMKILTVALGVCLVCAILVATTAVTLKPIQRQNQENDKLHNILSAAGLLQNNDADLQSLFRKHIRAEIIHLEKGIPIDPQKLDESLKADQFNIKEISKIDEYTRPLPPEDDAAQIKNVPRYMIVYNVIQRDSVTKRILPVYGKGLWSTMYGFLALGSDLRTIQALTFYEHGETPGLGGEVDNPRWKRLWIDKQAFDEEGELKIEVVKGQVNPASPKAKYQVDGLSGSTLTTRGVNNLVRFWLGKSGWGPYINYLTSAIKKGNL
ncbi:Na(+)-translocating NADH-quinone reductase subunit C [bacterium]|nr:Na(+)-translocating NADH-quinone reductase subunit C [bacterium]